MGKKNNSGKKVEKTNIPNLPSNRFFVLAALMLVVITTSIYYQSLNNAFTSWDDNAYVTENNTLKTLGSHTTGYIIKELFTGYTGGNYHPLTMLSYYMEYSKFQLNPKPYHVTNLILHLLNTLLVLYFIGLLSKQRWVAFITALLFAIHPMHVESVVWVSERKDLLYSFFYLSALCTYMFYIKNETNKWLFYAFTLVLFLCAALSKAMAVSLPITFFVLDFFMDRKITVKVILEKLPFIVLSIIFGLVAIEAQKSGNAFHKDNYDYIDRILFSSYGLILYLCKLFVPLKLAIFYSYPYRENGHYPVIFYISPLLLVGMGVFVYKLKQYRKDVLFGLGFFLTTIFLVLQLLPVGGSIISERYSYIPYIGLFFILAKIFNNLLENEYKNLAITTMIVVVFTFTYLSQKRTKVWHDSISLFTDFIETYDKKVPEIFYTRGSTYLSLKQYQLAIADFSSSIALRPDNPKVFFDRGVAYGNIGKYPEAINDFTTVITAKSNLLDAYNNRGSCYFNMRQYNNAINDYTEAIKLNPKEENFYRSRALTYSYIQQFDKAINDYKIALQLKKDNADTYCQLGMVYYNTGRFDDALTAYNNSIMYNPNVAFVYYNRAITYFYKKEFKPALADALKAKALGYQVNPNLMKDIETKISDSSKN